MSNREWLKQSFYYSEEDLVELKQDYIADLLENPIEVDENGKMTYEYIKRIVTMSDEEFELILIKHHINELTDNQLYGD